VIRLALSSAAAPSMPLGQLARAAARRGFAGLELRHADAHGVAPECAALAGTEAGELAAIAGLAITGFRIDRAGDDRRLARLSERLAAPVVLAGPDEIAGRVDRARRIAAWGGRARVVIRGPSVERDAAVARAARTRIAWEIDPQAPALRERAEALLARVGDDLRQIRLSGGGPETVHQAGMGIGGLMAVLAERAFRGTLVIEPSSPRFLPAWSAWLRESRSSCRGPLPLATPGASGSTECDA